MGLVCAENSYILQKTCLVAERDPTADGAPSCVSLAELLSAPHQHSQNPGLVGALVSGQQNPLASQLKPSLPGKTINHHYWLLGLLKTTLGRTILLNSESSIQSSPDFKSNWIIMLDLSCRYLFYLQYA